MAASEDGGHAAPSWFVSPGESDFLAWFTLGLVLVALYGIFYLYARFDRWAEHSASKTPLAKTIPTMLTIALLYEVFPLDHFHILLPLTAILLALAADLTNWRFGDLFSKDEADATPQVDTIHPPSAASQEVKDV